MLVASATMSRLADNLKRLRTQKGMSQQRLAIAVGVRQNTIVAIESGQTRRSKFLPKIAQVLQVPISELDPDIAGLDTVEPATKNLIVGERNFPIYGAVEG